MLRRAGLSEPSYLNAGSSSSLVRCWLQTVGLLSWRSVDVERPDRYDGHLHWVPGRFSPTEEEALY